MDGEEVTNSYASISHAEEHTRLHANKAVRKSLNLSKTLREANDYGLKQKMARILSMIVVARPMSSTSRMPRGVVHGLLKSRVLADGDEDEDISTDC